MEKSALIEVLIHDSPCEGALMTMMVCDGITTRLRLEYPHATVIVAPAWCRDIAFIPVEDLPRGFTVLAVGTVAEEQIRKTVQDSLDRVRTANEIDRH